MTEFLVRLAVAGDVAKIIELERATANAPHWLEAEYAAIAQKGKAECVQRELFVAESKGELIGFAVGSVVGYLAELESIAIDAGARRSGIGKALCRAVVDWAGAQGAQSVELEVRAASGGAIELYRSLKFVSVGRRPAYYSDPVDDAVLMRLDLEKEA